MKIWIRATSGLILQKTATLSVCSIARSSDRHLTAPATLPMYRCESLGPSR
jgi:hypothetical protein